MLTDTHEWGLQFAVEGMPEGHWLLHCTGPRPAIEALRDRFVAARIVPQENTNMTTAPSWCHCRCCTVASLVMAEGLARAEGRKPRPYQRWLFGYEEAA